MKVNKLFALCLTTLFVMGSAPVFAQGVFEGTADWDPFGDTHVEGSVDVSGSGANAVYEIQGNGNDIWANEDEGFFVYAEKAGSWALTSRIEWIETGGNEWAKAGLMVREDPDAPDSANYAVVLRGAMDTISAQWRPEAGSASSSTRHFDEEGNEIPAGDDNAVWIRVNRVSEDFWLSEYSQDGDNWNYGHSFTLELPESLAWGLTVTNHDDNDILAIANAENVVFEEAPDFHPVARRTLDGDLNVIDGNIFYQDGQEFEVTLEVFSSSAQDLTVTESLPDGWTVADISDDGTESGGVITWNLSAEEGANTLSYTVTADGSGNIEGDVDGYATVQEQGINYIKPGVGIFDDGSVDIGPVEAEGSSEFADGTYIVRGSGADIWGTGDQFHFVYTEMSGSFEVEVGEMFAWNDTSGNEWSKAGLMVRESLSPGAANVFPLVRGSDLQYRTQYRPENGAETAGTDLVPAEEQLGQVRLVRFGNEFTVEYFSEAEGDWVTNYQSTIEMEDPVLLGLAVTSHENPNITVAEYMDISVTEYPFSIARDIENFMLAQGESTTVTVNLDLREGESTDFTITESYPVDSITVSDVEASMGEAEDDGNGTITWTGSGAEEDASLTYTVTANPDATGTASMTGTYSDNGSFTGDTGEVILAFYDTNADISPFVESVDIGDVAAPGLSGKYEDTYAVVGSGADIWGTADEFHFAYLQAEGDFTMTVENVTLGGVGFNISTNDWQKAGIMARESLDAGSPMAIANIRSSDGAFMLQWREEQGIDAAWDEDETLTPAEDFTGTIRITREGDTFTSWFEDANGEFVVNNSHDVIMEDPILVGFAVTSHDDGLTSLGTFDNPEFEGETVAVDGWMLY